MLYLLVQLILGRIAYTFTEILRFQRLTLLKLCLQNWQIPFVLAHLTKRMCIIWFASQLLYHTSNNGNRKPKIVQIRTRGRIICMRNHHRSVIKSNRAICKAPFETTPEVSETLFSTNSIITVSNDKKITVF